MSTRITALCLVIASAGQLAALRGAEPGHNPNVPELAALEGFRGKWSGPVHNSDLTNNATSQWILEGRVMQTRFDVPGQLEGLIHRTYDVAGKQYVVTFLDSSGNVVLAPAEWDQSFRTMTATGPLGEDSFRLTNRFLNDDTEEWNVTITRPDGSIRVELTGTNHRQPG